MTMQYSSAGLALTKRFEGCELTAYWDGTYLAPETRLRKRWTVGYGHTGLDVYEGLTISQQQADELLAADLRGAVASVNHFVDAHVMLTQNQFDALVDFTFNVGSTALHGSTLLRLVNAGDFANAAAQFLAWDHTVGRIIAGLLRRREAERDLFETP